MPISSITSTAVTGISAQQPVAPAQLGKGRDQDSDNDSGGSAASVPRPTSNTLGQIVGGTINPTA